MNGYPEVDYDAEVWIAIPIWWGPESGWADHRVWARTLAEEVWADCPDRPGEYEVDNLALTLAMCAERFGPDMEDPEADLGGQTFLHLPHPRANPLPVSVFSGEDPAGDLREPVIAEDPEAVGAVEVTEFSTDGLGPGLRAFRRRAVPPEDADEPSEQYAVLRYAWHLPEHKTTVVLTASADPDAVLVAAADIDALARTITWQPA